MNSSLFFGLVMVAYLLASVLYVAGLVFRTDYSLPVHLGKRAFVFRAERLNLYASRLAWGAVLLHVLATLLRWWESHRAGMGHAPLTNMYESLVFFALCIALIGLVLERRYRQAGLCAFIMPLAGFTMAYASFADRIDSGIRPLIPALQSNWLVAHVVTCFIGYGAFAAAAALGLMLLLKRREDDADAPDTPGNQERTNPAEPAPPSPRLPKAAILDDLIHKTIIFGFLWLSAGIITGAVWAGEAWGTYWTWDPKESWSLITWFFYAFVLHIRLTRGWRGKIIACLAVLGFFVVLFTYFGVNFYLSGLHSYGAS